MKLQLKNCLLEEGVRKGFFQMIDWAAVKLQVGLAQLTLSRTNFWP